MKKRQIVLLLLVGLFLWCSAAQAADFSAYALKGRFVVNNSIRPLGEKDAVSVTWPSRNRGSSTHLTWWRSGEILREVPISNGYGYVLIPRSDGTCGVLLWENSWEMDEDRENFRYFCRNIRFCEWENDGLSDGTVIKGRYLEVAGEMTSFSSPEGFGLVERRDGVNWLVVYDETGEKETEVSGLPAGYKAMRLAGDGQGRWWVLLDSLQGDAQVWCVEKGAVLWQVKVGDTVHSVDPDLKGGVYVVEAVNDKSYTPLQVTHYGQDGKKNARKKFSGSKVVLSAAVLPLPEKDRAVLYGYAAAHSRKVYDVFRLEMDAKMKQRSLSVRSFNYFRDYEPAVLVRGTALEAFSSGGEETPEGEPGVLVPFEKLKKTKSPGLKLK